mmetsp:Transcript_52055/g.102737  ORF Transcript_52055/g.102737 Transcript_52055/m.102737 type:complete len:275 (+) Transcript_52055:53-877(+)
MSSTGSGYDYSCGTFSPDGRIFQVEYAQKAVENSSTAIGIKCSDGIVIAVGKSQASRMLVEGSNRTIFGVDAHAGIAVTGYAADGRQIVSRAREEAQSYRDTYGHRVIPSILANRLSLYMHYFTIYGSLRPFGATAILSAYDEDTKTPELYMLDPSGTSYRYHGCSAGKGANAAKTELEKILNRAGNDGITCQKAVMELGKILHLIRDTSKEKPLELEMGWLCAETGFKHAHVPKDLVLASDAAGKVALEGGATLAYTQQTGSAATEEKTMEVE